MAVVQTDPTPAAPNSWFDAAAGYALEGAQIYSKIVETKAAAQPNNATVYRAESATGAAPTGSVSTSADTAKKLPAWVLPVSIGGGVILLALAFLGLRRR